MSERMVLDVSPLPKFAFGHKGLIWWGTIGFMVIEGSMFVMAIIVYFYLRLQVDQWPPSLPDPAIGVATANLLVMLVSCVPNAMAKHAAEKFDLRKTQVWLVVLTLFGLAALVLRGFEYTQLNCRWDDNAYGSIVWLLLSLHTLHVATDVVDGAVLAALLFIGPVTDKRFVDASENSLYWHFIVAWWIPVYFIIFLAPRLL